MESKLFIVILMAFLLSGCGIAHAKTNSKIEVSSSAHHTIELKDTYNLDVSCDSGNIEVYTWKSDDIKFEITRRVSGTYKKEVLNKMLGDFEIDIKSDNNTVFLTSRYKGGQNSCIDTIVDFVIYMPKEIDSMNYMLGGGKIKLFDDTHGVLNADLNNTDIEINRFDGILNVTGNSGNVKISSGKMIGNSKVKKNSGNINIKSEFDEKGEYIFCTSRGYIDLITNSKVDFETVGELEINEFEDSMASSEVKRNDQMGKVRVESAMGKIVIKKY